MASFRVYSMQKKWIEWIALANQGRLIDTVKLSARLLAGLTPARESPSAVVYMEFLVFLRKRRR